MSKLGAETKKKEGKTAELVKKVCQEEPEDNDITSLVKEIIRSTGKKAKSVT